VHRVKSGRTHTVRSVFHPPDLAISFLLRCLVGVQPHTCVSTLCALLWVGTRGPVSPQALGVAPPFNWDCRSFLPNPFFVVFQAWPALSPFCGAARRGELAVSVLFSPIPVPPPLSCLKLPPLPCSDELLGPPPPTFCAFPPFSLSAHSSPHHPSFFVLPANPLLVARRKRKKKNRRFIDHPQFLSPRRFSTIPALPRDVLIIATSLPYA